MLPRNILPWKILWVFYNLFEHMLPGHISENQFANKNRPTTCENLWKSCLCIPHQQNGRHFLPSTFWDKEKTLHALPLLFPLFFRRNFAPAYGLPFQCNLTYFYYFLADGDFLLSCSRWLIFLRNDQPPCRCQKLTEVSHKKTEERPKKKIQFLLFFILLIPGPWKRTCPSD